MSFGKRLAALMKERKLTQEQVASLADASRATVAGWLSGTRPRDLDAVWNLSQALEVSFSYLLVGQVHASESASQLVLEDAPAFQGLCYVEMRRVREPRGKGKASTRG